MKAFFTALIIFIILIPAVIILSVIGSTRLTEYRDMIPDEGAVLSGAAEALSSLSDRIEDDRLLLVLLFSHERCNALKNAAVRSAAAARAEDDAEYAILRAELLGLLEDMGRDLRPGILDIL